MFCRLIIGEKKPGYHPIYDGCKLVKIYALSPERFAAIFSPDYLSAQLWVISWSTGSIKKKKE